MLEEMVKNGSLFVLLGSVFGCFAWLMNQFSEMRKEMNQGFASIRNDMDLKFREVDTRFREVDNRFREVDNRFREIDARFRQVDNRFVELEKDISIIKTVMVMKKIAPSEIYSEDVIDG